MSCGLDVDWIGGGECYSFYGLLCMNGFGVGGWGWVGRMGGRDGGEGVWDVRGGDGLVLEGWDGDGGLLGVEGRRGEGWGVYGSLLMSCIGQDILRVMRCLWRRLLWGGRGGKDGVFGG